MRDTETPEHAVQVLGQFVSFARHGDVPPPLLQDEAHKAIRALQEMQK